MKVTVVTALIALCAVANVAADWQLVWEDEFNGGDLKERWNFETGCGWYNEELQCYTDNRWENAKQENGMLVITARHEWWGDGVNPDRQFTSSRMTSKSNFLHGKFEMRARLPRGKHLWPAFWLLPAGDPYGYWPRSGEIDIMEYRGQRPTNTLGTLHFGASEWQHGQAGSPETSFPFDFSQDFHVFGLDWSPTQIQWLIDGQVFHTESLQRNFAEGFYTAWGQPFDKNFYMIINLAVGGTFFGGEPFDPIESDSWPKNTFEIDWIRKWEWR